MQPGKEQRQIFRQYFLLQEMQVIQSKPKMGTPVYLNLLTEGTRFRAAETNPPRQNSAH